MTWGVPGMILAIPMLAILKIVMENIDPLKPYAYLISGTGGESKTYKIKDKIKGWFSE